MFSALWNDNSGGVITSELVLVASVTVGTLLTGLTALRSGLIEEYQAVEKAIKSQSLSATLDADRFDEIPDRSNYVELFDPSLLEEVPEPGN